MRIRTSLLALGLTLGAFAAAPAFAAGAQSAAGHETAQPTQQQKMKICNDAAKAKSLKGADRKEFMSNCLKKDHSAAAGHENAQQEKMKTCNADAKAKGVKGSARKAFMSSCLKG